MKEKMKVRGREREGERFKREKSERGGREVEVENKLLVDILIRKFFNSNCHLLKPHHLAYPFNAYF